MVLLRGEAVWRLNCHSLHVVIGNQLCCLIVGKSVAVGAEAGLVYD